MRNAFRWDAIDAAADPYNQTGLPYHNQEHAKQVAEKAVEIGLLCNLEGLEVNIPVVYCGAKFHDVRYDWDTRDTGFSNKEEYAAYLAAKCLKELGAGVQFIVKVEQAILGTRRDGRCLTVEAKVLRAADLANLAGPYTTFLEANRKLKAEAEILMRQRISHKTWLTLTESTIKFYLSQDIRLTSHYSNDQGKSIFHIKTRENLQRFLRGKTA